MKKYFIAGIGTDVGKTITAAIIVEKLKADYWKPIQSGDLEMTDTMKVQSMVGNSKSKYHSEAYKLTQPYSPHYAAELDHTEISLDQICLPKINNDLIIEGAGGLMVPLNNKFLILDLIRKLDVEVILVSRNYLGSINHTLLSIELLKTRDIPIKGIIFNGDSTPSSENYILKYSGIDLLGKIDWMNNLSKEEIFKAGNNIHL